VVSTQVEPQGVLVLIDGQLALLLAEGDADRSRGETLAQVAAGAVAGLQRAISETGETRSRERLWRAVWRSAVATGLFLAFVALVMLVRRWLNPRLRRATERAARAVRVGGTEVIAAERLASVVRVVVAGAAGLLVAVAAYRWISFVLVQFPYTRPWGEGLLQYFTGLAFGLGGGILRSLPDLLVAAVIFLLARGVIGLAAPVFDRAEAGRTPVSWLDRDSARPTRRLVNLAVWLFALVMAYPYLPGSQSEAFKGMSVLVGLMVTIGGASVFGQAASGLILMYARVLRVGEYVRIDDQEGTVVEMGTFTTRIRTGLGEEVSLPNALVLGTVTKNYSRAVQGRGYVVDTVVTIGYDTPWRQVEAMLVEAARRTPDVLAQPEPRVFQTELSDFYPQYRLVCQALASDPRPRAVVLTRLHANIQDVFNEHGVQIMSPHYLGDPAKAKVVPPSAWYPPPARPPVEEPAPREERKPG
jgi:small-conductance mechanosensitive channel